MKFIEAATNLLPARSADRAVPLPRTVKRPRRRLSGLRFWKRGVVRNSVPLRFTRARSVNRPRESTRARSSTTGVTGVGSRARRTDRPVSGSAPGTADAIVPRNVTWVPADTVRDAGRRDSATFGNAAGKKPGRRDDGNRASADLERRRGQEVHERQRALEVDGGELARVDRVDVVDVEHQVAAAARARADWSSITGRSARDRTVVGQLLQRAAVGDRVAAAAANGHCWVRRSVSAMPSPALWYQAGLPGPRRARCRRCGRPG